MNEELREDLDFDVYWRIWSNIHERYEFQTTRKIHNRVRKNERILLCIFIEDIVENLSCSPLRRGLSRSIR